MKKMLMLRNLPRRKAAKSFQRKIHDLVQRQYCRVLNSGSVSLGSSPSLPLLTVSFQTSLLTISSLNLGMLLTALDFNIVATAVPIISSEFNAYSNSSWLGTGFLISFALVLPIYAKLGDICGRRNMFIFGTIIFILGSGLCGGSNSMNMLIWSRVVQGIGGGGIYGLVNVGTQKI